MRQPLLVLSIFLAYFTTSSAQENNPLINSGAIIEEAIKLHENGKYKDAIEQFKKVNRSDTNYVLALYEMSLSCMADSQYLEGIRVCQLAMAEKTDRERLPDILTQYASLVDNAGDKERAIQIFDSALQIYPAYSLLYLNKGTTLMRLGKLSEAEAVFKKCILIDPYSSSSHFKLGIVSLQMGRLVPCVLSLMNYLFLSPDGYYSNNCITLLSSIATNKDDIKEYIDNRTGPPATEYEFAEQIIQSKIALDKNYKPVTKLDDPISRQLQVMLEKLDYGEASDDFWMQYYIPIYNRMFKTGKFEYLINYMFSGVNLPDIKSFNKKNKKEIEAMIDEMVVYFNKIRSTRELIYSKRNSSDIYYHYVNGKYTGKGKVVNNGEKFVGDWTFYYPGGNIKSKGQFNANGERNGIWQFYYANGDLNVQTSYLNGKQNGVETYYYTNGVEESKGNYMDDKLEAEGRTYFYSGKNKAIVHYTAGKLNGERRTYSRNGTLLSVENYLNDNLHGSFKTYHENGGLESEGTYINGELDNIYKAWHSNGKLATEGQYSKNKYTGTWKKYHENGKLKSTQNFNGGIAEGVYEEYHYNGLLFTKYSVKKGKEDGEVSYFDDDGKLYSVYVYDNGKAKGAKYFDKSGKLISTSEAKGGKLDLTTFYPEGMRRSKVEYNGKGNAEGTGLYYYPSGKLSQTYTYNDGKLDGKAATYFINGQVNTEQHYKSDQKDGYSKTYYQHGTLASEGWYQENSAESAWRYYDELGNLTTINYFSNDELDGHKEEFHVNGKIEYDTRYYSGWIEEMTQYDTTGKAVHHLKMEKGNGKFTGLHPNGRLAFEGNYVQGQFEGAYSFYYFDGSKRVTEFFKGGELDSIYRSYFYGGRPSVEGQFKHGKKTGSWKYYKSRGELYLSEEYVDGELDGHKKYYFPDGKLEMDIEYANDQRHGLTSKFDPAGNLAYQLRYDYDLPVGYSFYDQSGKMVPEIPILKGNGRLKSYYPNGKLAVDYEYRDGKVHGPNKIYYSNGKVWSEMVDEYGITNGPIKNYYENGQLQSVCNYLNDNPHGSCKLYNEKGILKEDGNYYNGTFHGELKIFDDNGKLKETQIYYHGTLLKVNK